MKTFEEWLKEEYPRHSVYDHHSQRAYDWWKSNLKKAYEGGIKAYKEHERTLYKRDQELTSPYGDNNPPLPMSNPGDKDYEC